uniref:Uncharacterized protein n=1 Tax=Anguilla anguilla TaxID=7936 RepID=A0A0E9RKM6_ANGAN
MANSQATKYKR